MAKLIAKFDTVPVNPAIDPEGGYLLRLRDRPVYDESQVFEEVVKEKTLPIDKDISVERGNHLVHHLQHCAHHTQAGSPYLAGIDMHTLRHTSQPSGHRSEKPGFRSHRMDAIEILFFEYPAESEECF